MERTIKIKNILSQIRQMDYDTSLYLMERIVRLLKKNKNNINQTSYHLADLNNLGSEIWKDVNIDQYIQQERQWE
ncbi:MAG: hypothetical protein ABII90_13005 [Bacteroidota bacterium]